MRQTNLCRSIKTLFLTAIVLTVASVTLGQSVSSGGFRRVASEPYSGRVVLINRLKSYPPGRRIGAIGLRTPINLGWQKARPALIALLYGVLNERNIGSGFRTSRNDLYLAENGTLFIGTDGTGFTLRFVLAGNHLTTSIRTPGPSPSGTDPRFGIGFDAEITVDVDRTASGGIGAGPARLKINVKRPTGENITGDLAIAANNLFNFLSGRDFIGEGISLINKQEYALSKPIDLELGRMLDGLTGRNTIITPVWTTDARGSKELRLILEDDNGGPIVN